jgi:hypothetical protein
MRSSRIFVAMVVLATLAITVTAQLCGYYGMPCCLNATGTPTICHEGECQLGICIHCGDWGEPVCRERTPGCIFTQYDYDNVGGFCRVKSDDCGHVGYKPCMVNGESVCREGKLVTIPGTTESICIACGDYEQPCCTDTDYPCDYGECVNTTCKRNLTEDALILKDINDLYYSSSPFIRKAAAVKLARSGDERAIRPLIVALKDDGDWEVRATVAEALVVTGDDRAVDPLIGALKDPHWYVRKKAAEALGSIGDARVVDPSITSKAVEPLIEALKDNDEGVREAASEALDKIRAE